MPQGVNSRDLTLTRDGANPIGKISSAASAIDTRPPSTFTSSWVVREYAHVEAYGSVKAKIPRKLMNSESSFNSKILYLDLTAMLQRHSASQFV
jgi:hypothetical protein